MRSVACPHYTEHWSGKGGLNSRPRPWQGRALPTELFPLCLLLMFDSQRGRRLQRFGAVVNCYLSLNLYGQEVIITARSGMTEMVHTMVF